MRIRWSRAWIGYEKKVVLDYLEERRNAFQEKKRQLQLEHNRVIEEIKGLTRKGEELTALASPNSWRSRLTMKGNQVETDEAFALPVWNTVFFGLNKRQAKGILKRIYLMEQEELQELKERLAAARLERTTALERLERYEQEKAPAQAPKEAEVPSANVSAVSHIQDEDMETTPPRGKEEPSASGKLIAFPIREHAVIHSSTVSAKSLEAAAPQAVLISRTAVGMGFWGDTDRYLEQPVTHQTQQYYESIPTSASYPAHSYYDDASQVRDKKREASTEAADSLEAIASNPPAAQDSAVFVAGAEEAAATTESASTAVSQEIRALRSKYIVGKLAGEDLLDARGKLIVAKHHVITEQVMLQAERQGKLAELIVNMQIPGLDEL